MSPLTSLLIHDHEGVRTLTLNRPDRRNALDIALIEGLLAAIEAADADPGTGVLVLCGAGQAFCSGADMVEFRDAGTLAASHNEHRNDLLAALLLRFASLRKPVIAAVGGAALGAGAALALAADMVVMDADARLGYPETRHAMIPSLMAGSLLTRVGRTIAFELLVTGQPIDAARAHALGLANRIVESGTAAAAAHGLAADLARLDRYAVAGTKRILDACTDLPLEEALREGRALGRWLKAERPG